MKGIRHYETWRSSFDLPSRSRPRHVACHGTLAQESWNSPTSPWQDTRHSPVGRVLVPGSGRVSFLRGAGRWCGEGYLGAVFRMARSLSVVGCVPLGVFEVEVTCRGVRGMWANQEWLEQGTSVYTPRSTLMKCYVLNVVCERLV